LQLFAPLVVAGVVAFAPGLASADKVMLLMDSGSENTDRMKLLSKELSAAGHKPMVTGASLEDSALMLGCTPSEGSCIDLVIETGGADGAVIVPQDVGELLVRRGGVGNSAKVAAGGSDYDWKVALSQAFGLPAPAAPAATASGKVDLSSSSSSSGGGMQFSKVKTRSWVVLGSGAATSIVGLVLLNIASGKQEDVNGHPVDTAADLEALRDLESSGENFNLYGNVFVIAGGLATVAGVGLMVWDMKSGQAESGPTFVPTASDTSVGVSLRWDNF
jgi:hypothetical protein